jgi:hypothetical protein
MFATIMIIFNPYPKISICEDDQSFIYPNNPGGLEIGRAYNEPKDSQNFIDPNNPRGPEIIGRAYN